MTFEIVEKNRKSSVKFCLFGKSFGCDFSHFSELLVNKKNSHDILKMICYSKKKNSSLTQKYGHA
jgi:hypothetical protein